MVSLLCHMFIIDKKGSHGRELSVNLGSPPFLYNWWHPLAPSASKHFYLKLALSRISKCSSTTNRHSFGRIAVHILCVMCVAIYITCIACLGTFSPNSSHAHKLTEARMSSSAGTASAAGATLHQLCISVHHLCTSVHQLFISVQHLCISVQHLCISVQHLCISVHHRHSVCVQQRIPRISVA